MRSAGVLMPITSLPSPWGIGTLGRSAKEFLDFLAESGQTYWQLLPIGPTGYGDSPYQPFSSYAGNPYLIDLDDLAKVGLLLPEEYQGIQWSTNPARVDYGLLYQKRFQVLKKAVDRLWANNKQAVQCFCDKESYWLEDYSLFMSLKSYFGGRPWNCLLYTSLCTRFSRYIVFVTAEWLWYKTIHAQRHRKLWQRFRRRKSVLPEF